MVELERVTGVEPASPAWKAGALAIELHPRARNPGAPQRIHSLPGCVRARHLVAPECMSRSLIGRHMPAVPEQRCARPRTASASPRPPGNGRHWRTWDLEVVMWRAARWGGGKKGEMGGDVLAGRRWDVVEEGAG